MLRQHAAGGADDLVDSISLETYKFKFEYENIDCAHCGYRMTDFYDLDVWPYGVDDFLSAFDQVARGMVEMGNFGPGDPHLVLRGDIVNRQCSLHICPMCAWWAAVDSAVLPAIGRQVWLVNLVAPAALMELDVADLSIPLNEVRSYLRRRYDTRHSLHPRRFEQVVASVFEDIGYDAEATAYTNDGGIDVVLRGRMGERIGIQVKRRGRTIEVGQIRAFLGALMLGGYARGVFVATTSFQHGAIRASESCRKFVPIELVDAERFFDLLGIAQLSGEVDPETCGFQEASKPGPFLHSAFHLSSL